MHYFICMSISQFRNLLLSISLETCSSQLFTLHFHDKNNLKEKQTV